MKALVGIYAALTGRPSYPPLLLVKTLLLQQWYHRSDPQLEEAWGDRLSCRPRGTSGCPNIRYLFCTASSRTGGLG